MKKIFVLIAIFFFAFLAVATAQERKETAYGWRLNDNRNLRFEDSTKVHTEICGGAHGTFGDINAGGIDFGVSRVYTPSQNFAFAVGGMMSFDYNKDFGSMTDFLAQGKIGFGNSYGIELVGLAGVGQLAYRDNSTNGTNRAVYHNTAWRATAGGEVALFTKASKEIWVRLFGRYTSYLNHKGDRSYEEAEGWQHAPTQFNLSKVTVGASATVRVGGAHQVSGDRCWQSAVFSGYSFGKNEGWVVGAEIFHTKRTAEKSVRLIGFGSQQTFGEGTSFNEIYGKFGWQLLHSGAKSLIIPEFGAKLGGGEYLKAEAGSTDNNSYSMRSTVQVPGVVGKLYVVGNLHFGANCVKIGVEGGAHTTFKTNFKSKTSPYDGKTRDKVGGDALAYIGFSRAF